MNPLHFLRKSGLSTFAVFLIMAIPATLSAGCTMFFSSAAADPSETGVLVLSLAVLALLNGAIWKFVKGVMKQ